ncbi:MAG: T9SS type A sorting domain-containing protein, partial [Bacteroidales bacterium]|nr:T9SS type A sorting domain-containing protein [Bacteroidales bacterium]
LKTFRDGCDAEPFVRLITVRDNASAPPAAVVYRKSDDNFLYCDDQGADEYRWGWFRLVDSRIVGEPFYIPGKNQWYCRLPDGYSADSDTNRYFVEIRYNGMECFSRTFFNAPVNVNEMNTGQIDVFPNPSDQAIFIRFHEIGSPAKADLKIYDFIGHLVHSETLPGMIRNTTVTVNEARNFKPGIYIICIRLEDRLFKYKIIVR